MEQLNQTESIDNLFNQILESEPKLVTNFVPEAASAAQQKTDFMAANIRNPNHLYDRLDSIDFEKSSASIMASGERLLSHPDLDPKQSAIYGEFIDGYLKKTRMLELARGFKHADNPNEKAHLKNEYMQLNIELYGEPDKTTYESLLQEKLQKIDQKVVGETGQRLKSELFDMLDHQSDGAQPERFKPSSQTLEWMHGVVETLYGDMLSHVPEKATFTNNEVAAIFTDIIDQEFGESAQGWRVDIENAKAINVKTAEKRIVIPENRADINAADLKGLIVHELGVHMMRSIIGSETDLLPLRIGLNDYYDAEEGLGVVMEQALKGKFRESGIDHYITAGLAYFDEKDFRDTFEIKWRLSALSLAADGTDVTDEMIAKAKNGAYGGVMRSFRGTDELPWFKDLSYYNGAMDVWKHLENIAGDDLKFMFVLMGKANPANKQHEHILLETRTL